MARELRLDERGRPVRGRYTGPAFPLGPEPDGVLGPKPDINVILTSIFNIITTPKGSVPYDPELGSEVPYLLFELETSAVYRAVNYFARKDLRDQEPRIQVSRVDVDRVGDGEIRTVIHFGIIGDSVNRTYHASMSFRQKAGVLWQT